MPNYIIQGKLTPLFPLPSNPQPLPPTAEEILDQLQPLVPLKMPIHPTHLPGLPRE